MVVTSKWILIHIMGEYEKIGYKKSETPTIHWGSPESMPVNLISLFIIIQNYSPPANHNLNKNDWQESKVSR